MERLAALAGGAPGLLQAWRAHAAGEVSCCDVAPGGARLLTAGGDRALRCWAWRAGRGWLETAAAPRAHRYGVTCCAWAPGGALAASGGVDGAARVWAARDLAPRRLLAAPAAPALRCVCWAAGGLLLCGYDDGTAAVWRVRGAVLMARLHAHEGALHALCAPARAALLLTACTDGVLKVFDLHEVCRSAAAGDAAPAPLVWEDGAHDMGALCCACAEDGRLAATGGRDARVRLWRVRGPGAARRVEAGATLEGHGAAVTSLRWARGLLTSASLDRTARVWSAAGECLLLLHAHERYLTCVAPDPDLRYLMTGSNDKSIRMWALGDLTLDDELEPPCDPFTHFGVGDLEGIGPVDEEGLLADEPPPSEEGEGSGEGGAARLLHRDLDTHAGAVNCIALHEDMLATACSDGLVRVFAWNGSRLEARCELGTRGYPVLAVEFCSDASLLVAAGLDGTARLWDVQSGGLVRSLVAPQASEHESGGGGARAARVWRRRLLLAGDDGRAAVWSLAQPDPAPLQVYAGHAEAATSCAWGAAGRLAAAGGAAGELRLHGAPPRARTLRHLHDAHDLGVQSVDFAPAGALDAPDDVALLASAGSDGLIKLWRIDLHFDADETICDVDVELMTSAMAHGGGAAWVRWRAAQAGVVSAGADGWARVWRLARGRGAPALRQLAAVPALGAAGTATAMLLGPELVVLGSLSGELAVWRLPGESGGRQKAAAETDETDETDESDGEDAELEPRWWGAAGVARWIKECITREPEGAVSPACEAALLAARAAGVSGARLLDAAPRDLLRDLGYDEDEADADADADTEQVPESSAEDEAAAGSRRAVRARLREELAWLRRDPPPPQLAAMAPHCLLCPLSHRLLAAPVSAADGITYERTALYEWFLAAEGPVSAVSGRRLRSAAVRANRGARRLLRDFLTAHAAGDSPAGDLQGTHE